MTSNTPYWNTPATLVSLAPDGADYLSPPREPPRLQAIKDRMGITDDECMIVVGTMIRKGYLWPYRTSEGIPITERGHFRGVTEDGEERYEELRAPRRAWLKRTESWVVILLAAGLVVNIVLWGIL